MSSFPNVIYGGYGDDKKTHSASPGGMPLGQKMVLPDGRVFRLAKAGSATALTAGVVVSTTAAVTGHGAIAGSGLLASATATENLSGQNLVHLITKTVAVTKDQYAGGYMNVQLSAGNAEVYHIKANDSAATAARCKFELDENIKTAFAAGSTAVSLRKSAYTDAIVYATGTVIARIMGVTPAPVAVNQYFWVQRGGLASVRQSATVCVVGQGVFADTAIAGSVTTLVQATTGSASTTELQHYLGSRIGTAVEAPAASEACLVNMELE